jgi:hypothetical protein
MTRYRKSPSNSGQTSSSGQTAAKPPATAEGETIIVTPKGSKKTINYIWMPDKDGNLVKKDSAFVRKSFASLSKEAQDALAEYVLAVQQRQPTDAARKTAFNALVSAAETAFKEGKKFTPWDILERQAANAPALGGPTISYTAYDKITSDAILSQAAKQLGFAEGSFAQFGEQDKADFFKKLVDAAKSGAKIKQTIVKPDGTTEIVETPGGFDANTFAKNYLWAKANIGDPKTLPTSVINQIDTLRSVLKANGLGYYGNKEISNFALQLAKGDISLTDLQKQFNTKAAELYPLFGERLKANPNLTVMDLAEPYINTMAKWWEIDPGSIDLSNPDLDKFLRPDGTAGKVPMGSLAEFTNYLKNHPNAEKTTWANDAARDLATGFARAAGFGV